MLVVSQAAPLRSVLGGGGGMKICSATSLAPAISRKMSFRDGAQFEVGAAYQRGCFESARELFGNHVALNFDEELEALKAALPNLQIKGIGPIRRRFGTRPLLDFAMIKSYFQQSGAEICAILNSDIYIDWYPEALAATLEALRPEYIMYSTYTSETSNININIDIRIITIGSTW